MVGRFAEGRGRGAGLGLTLLALLLTTLQFLIGVWVQLYDTHLPTSIDQVFQSPYVSTERALALHVVVGALLGVVAIALVVWAAVRHRPRVLGAAIGGLLGVLLAAVAGDWLLLKGDPIDSFVMALGFLLALGAYMRAVTVLRRRDRGVPGVWGPGPGTSFGGAGTPPSSPPG